MNRFYIHFSYKDLNFLMGPELGEHATINTHTWAGAEAGQTGWSTLP